MSADRENYLSSGKSVVIEHPYVRLAHQIQNLVRFGELAAKVDLLREICLITGVDNGAQKADFEEKFEILHERLLTKGIEFKWTFSTMIHDRAVKLDSGWTIKIGRGLYIYQKPESWYRIGSNDFDLRPCLETTVDIYRS